MNENYPFYHTYVRNSFAEENTFGARYCNPWAWSYFNQRYPDERATQKPVGYRPEVWPTYPEVREKLPKPFWKGHDDVIACYWKVWELAFNSKLRKATPENRFVSDFNGTAFNDCTFMWDSAFIAMFGLYGRRVWNFQATLDNFYCKQHPDGFICREIGEVHGEDRFQRFDPSATGPNVLPWAEWEYYRQTGDRDRLARVFPPLAAYTRWMRLYRTWPSGGYWATGWSCGMDNQPRIPEGYHIWYDHAHQTWVDTCMQAVLADRILVEMAKEIGRDADAQEFFEEKQFLVNFINTYMWDDNTAFYHDLRRDGTRITQVKTIGAYWALLADVVPVNRLVSFVDHLTNPKEFNRTHRVPSLSADTPGYDPDGGYWRGAIWAPTNYMILRGLYALGYGELAHQIGYNHLQNVTLAFTKTGTLWENYAPDFPGEGRSHKDFVGWTGLVPVSVLFESVFGLHPDAIHQRLVWDVRLLDEYGVEDYPFGQNGLVSLKVAARKKDTDPPDIQITTNVPLELEVRWNGGRKIYRF